MNKPIKVNLSQACTSVQEQTNAVAGNRLSTTSLEIRDNQVIAKTLRPGEDVSMVLISHELAQAFVDEYLNYTGEQRADAA